MQDLARLAEGRQDSNGSDVLEAIRLPLRASQNGRYVFCAHARYGHATVYRDLESYVPENFGIIGLQDPIHGGSEMEFPNFEAVIATYADVVCQQQPTGPVDLLGWSYGGHIVFALSQELERRGREVASLIIIDTKPIPEGFVSEPDDVLPQQAGRILGDIARQQEFLAAATNDLAQTFGEDLDEMLASTAQKYALAVSGLRCEQMMSEPTRGVSQTRSMIVLAGDRAQGEAARDTDWKTYLPNHHSIRLEDCDHYSVMTPPRGVSLWGPKLYAMLNEQ